MIERLAGRGWTPPALNFSHGDRRASAARCARVRARRRSCIGRPLAVIADLQGPKIRIGAAARAACSVNPGDTVVLAAAGARRRPATSRSPSSSAWRDVVRPGTSVLIDDGQVRAARRRGARPAGAAARRGRRPDLVGQGRQPARARTCRSRRSPRRTASDLEFALAHGRRLRRAVVRAPRRGRRATCARGSPTHGAPPA